MNGSPRVWRPSTHYKVRGGSHGGSPFYSLMGHHGDALSSEQFSVVSVRFVRRAP